MNRLSPSDVELSERLFWLVKLRWLFLVGLSALLFFAVEIFRLRLELAPLISIAAVVLAYNLVLFVVHRLRIKSGAIPTSKVLRIEANFQTGLDLIALIFLVYFSGGIENPFTFFFIFHMIVGSILLAGRDIWYHAFVTVFGLMALLYLSLNGYVPHHHIEGFASPGAWRTPAYVYSAGIAFSATMLLTVYMTSSISRSVWKREQELIGANDELRKKSIELQSANRELIRQQNLLVQSEKLASKPKKRRKPLNR